MSLRGFPEGRERDSLTAVLVNTVGATGEDNTLGLEGEVGHLLGAGQHLTVDIDLSQSPGQEMRLGRGGEGGQYE